jgi:hypothetical protein
MIQTQTVALRMAMAVLMIAVGSTGHAAVTIVSSSRSVAASATLSCGSLIDSSSQSTLSTGAFNATVSETVSGLESNNAGGFCISDSELIFGAASQNTNVSNLLSFGSGTANAGKANGSMESGLGTGSSMLTVDFQVTASAPYSLSGTVDALETLPGFFLRGIANV